MQKNSQNSYLKISKELFTKNRELLRFVFKIQYFDWLLIRPLDWLAKKHFENDFKLLIIWLYECLTGKNVQTLDGEYNDNFTDARYQAQLPLYARNTASYAIKVSPTFTRESKPNNEAINLTSFTQTNIRVTEEIRCPNLNTNKRKNELILKLHQGQKETKKNEFPDRFEIVPTLAELCSKHK